MKNFAKAVAHIFEAEGGYVNNPYDRGGPTNFGITLATLAAHRGRPATANELSLLTKSEAEAIYLTRYWTPNGFDALASATVATVVFDQAVNRGPRIAVRALQSVLELTTSPGLDIDGDLGAQTALAANQAPERQLTIALIIEAQRGYVELWRAYPTQAHFLPGWLARTWQLFRLL